MSKLILIDSHYLAHRVKFRLIGLSYEEQSTGVIFGFLNSILLIAETFSPCQFVFAWDSTKSLRRRICKTYKKRETPVDEKNAELNALSRPQFIAIRDKVLPKIGFKNIFLQVGYEADDLMAKIVEDYHKENEIVIVSRDQDLYQLLDRCRMWDVDKKESYTIAQFREQFGIEVPDWIRVKSIAGCDGDNVEGVKGVGEMTAIKYIKGILPKHHKSFQRIEQSSDIIELNEKLVRLPFESVESVTIQNSETFFLDDFLDICNDYEFLSFINTGKFDRWKKVFNMKGDL